MPGALRSLALPPAPIPDAQSQSGVLGNGPAMPQVGGPAPAAPPGPAAMPAPDHKQTVAALRHFDAIGKQLETALRDPELGKANLKSKVIDGMTSLVSTRILSPGEAVQQLSTFPDRPFDQKAWLMDHLTQTLKARDAVLDHHAAAFAGGGPEPTPDADSHMQDISGMMQSHYGRSPNA